MRTTSAVALLLVLAATSAARAQETLAPADGPRHVLVADGEARATIVLPEKPDGLETYAANELAKYAERITGAKLPIVREPEQPTGYAVRLGRTQKAESAGFTLTEAKLGRDGYAARADEHGLVVVGRCPLGTLFGTYDVIEREFGVRWCVRDELGEVVPAADTLSVGTFRRELKPSFDYRWVDSGDWSLKQRMNVQVQVDGKPVGVNWKWHFHTFAILIPPEKHFDDHPEWFPLVGGKRQKSTQEHSHSTQLCTTNPEVVDKLTEGLLETLDADPTIEIITLSPNDGGGFCECPGCTALDEPHRGWFARYSKRLAVLNQQIAGRVAERYPKVKIKIGAYAMYALPPEIEGYRPEENSLVQLCHIYFCHNHPITSGKCEAGKTYEPSDNFLPNQEFRKLAETWSKLTGNLFIYEYYALGGWSRSDMLWPMVHTMRHDVPWYRDLGAKGFYTQTGPWQRAPLNYYVAAKLAWNADLDVDWLIDDFCRKFFEDAAEPMKAYLAETEAAMVRSDQCISYGLRAGRANVLGPKILDQPTRDKLRSYLDTAKQQAKTDPARQRIAALRDAFDQCEASIAKLEKR
ncbi:MAG TPA: DUF4838 domain-containing protein [Thermoguttaceae bacterium]|nr:DUF4838 domain-containing protein [Thermoguttaceae bacterium]